MRITPVSLKSTDAATQAGYPALTPELLAATGARYSRNNEGLQSIISKIDPNNMDASVDSIFKMIDYGHQSIADMVPVAMFIDDISLFMAYYIWTLCPTAGGQESSTRYIQLSESGLINPDILGIPKDKQEKWIKQNKEAFKLYEEALEDWGKLAQLFPENSRIPAELLNDDSPKTKKKVERMLRNYNFDRARYYIPLGASTNMMLVMSARAWVALCQHLCSHYLPEALAIGKEISQKLQATAPRLIHHATFSQSYADGIKQEFNDWVQEAQTIPNDIYETRGLEAQVDSYFDILSAPRATNSKIANDLVYHTNRYSYFGTTIKRTAVRFGYQAVAIAEIRDLNRHRTGNKYCPLIPQGFYDAEDELPISSPSEIKERFFQRREFAKGIHNEILTKLQNSDYSYIYDSLLGTQFPFEHTTTADKFLYEAELRTGIGSHYRYAQHLAESLNLWQKQYPETAMFIQAGTAEPE